MTRKADDILLKYKEWAMALGGQYDIPNGALPVEEAQKALYDDVCKYVIGPDLAVFEGSTKAEREAINYEKADQRKAAAQYFGQS